MAEKKSNGFRTFLLILTTILLTGVFGIAGYLVLVPESSVFGLQYLSNSTIHIFDKFSGNTLVNFSGYNKIVVDVAGGKGHTHVQVNYDNPMGMINSQIILAEDTKGFTRVGSSLDYDISVNRSGGVMTISVTEPEYNFLQLVNNTVLKLNVHQNDSISGAEIIIKTGSGNVRLGGKSTDTGIALKTTTGKVDIKTLSGNITLTEDLEVTSSASFVSESGSISILGKVDDHLAEDNSNQVNNKTIPSVVLQSKTGKISTADINGDISIKTFNSHVALGNIVGDIDVDMESGILNLKNVGGNLVSENHLLYTAVSALEVKGNVTLINDDGNFAVDIKSVKGETAIRTGNKTVKIGNVEKACTVRTINGIIDVTKSASNTSDLVLTTTGGGSVYLSGDKLRGNNTVSTQNGSITLKFGSEATFDLKASSEKNKVYRTWLDSYENPIESAVGAENSGNKVTLTTKNGFVKVERV